MLLKAKVSRAKGLSRLGWRLLGNAMHAFEPRNKKYLGRNKVKYPHIGLSHSYFITLEVNNVLMILGNNRFKDELISITGRHFYFTTLWCNVHVGMHTIHSSYFAS
jgi:hypothetical protein